MASPDPYSGRPGVPLLPGWARARSALGAALRLPTFAIAGAGIVNVFNPVFSPGGNADNLLRWLQKR